MARTSYRVAGRIEKTVGRRGEVVVVAPDDLPLLIAEGMELWPLPPALRGARSMKVRSVEGTASSARLRLEGIDDLDASSKLVGKWLLGRSEDLGKDLALLDRRSAIGLTVIDDAKGPLGRVEEVIVGDYQDLWVVRGEGGEVLVPVAEDLIRVEEGVAHTRLPEGLVG